MSDKNSLKSSKTYTAVIIGAGNIGVAFDTPDSPEVLTHAHAYAVSKRIRLAGLHDIDASAGKKAAETWGIPYFEDLECMFKSCAPDIVSIATPDGTHAGILKKILAFNPRAVICEKPFSTDAREGASVSSLYRSAGVPIIVNYRRRFDGSMETLKNEIKKGTWGKIKSATGAYVRGVKHNGSHMVNLCLYLFGACGAALPSAAVTDYSENDPTVSAFLSFEYCSRFHLVGMEQKNYGVFELDIFFERGRVRLVDEGYTVENYGLESDPRFPGYTILGKGTPKRTLLDKAFIRLMDTAAHHLDGTDAFDFNAELEAALETDRICGALAEGAKPFVRRLG